MPTSLVWFTNNLRVQDNSALLKACKKNQPLICVFFIDPLWQNRTQYGTHSLGAMRNTFLIESLAALAETLSQQGQRLHVIASDPIEGVKRLVALHAISDVFGSQQFGTFEREQWKRLKSTHPHVNFHQSNTFTLFDVSDFSSLEGFPKTFSQFRQVVSGKPFRLRADMPDGFPPPLRVTPTPADHNIYATDQNRPDEHYAYFLGGEASAIAHMEAYFDSAAPSTYKETRNMLDGKGHSTKFSPWLANGSLSVRVLYDRLVRYEKEVIANRSTEWILFELLWREYFQWYAEHFKSRVFRFSGISNSKPLTSFYSQRFQAWCTGNTPWPLVNACMRQLNVTGYMSNRGRQIVASCLTNELQLDWRCGAYYFEQQLLDYDVASNWGNWQYIAGVGADPRGGRHFNIDKQTDIYDPDGAFIRRWYSLSHISASQSGESVEKSAKSDALKNMRYVDAFDAADWPIEG